MKANKIHDSLLAFRAGGLYRLASAKDRVELRIVKAKARGRRMVGVRWGGEIWWK